MNWFRRHSQKKKNEDQESINTAFTTAVAAAAFAIQSLEEAEALKNKNGNSRFSFKKTKSGGETLMRQATIQNHGAIERTNSARKPTLASSRKLKSPEKAQRKAEGNDKLKSLVAWANIKKMKLKVSNQSKKKE